MLIFVSGKNRPLLLAKGVYFTVLSLAWVQLYDYPGQGNSTSRMWDLME